MTKTRRSPLGLVRPLLNCDNRLVNRRGNWGFDEPIRGSLGVGLDLLSFFILMQRVSRDTLRLHGSNAGRGRLLRAPVCAEFTIGCVMASGELSTQGASAVKLSVDVVLTCRSDQGCPQVKGRGIRLIGD